MAILDHYPAAAKPARFNPARLQQDEIKLLPTLVGDPPDVVGYLRTGGCTAGCGACCGAFVVPVALDALADKEFKPVSEGQIMLPIKADVGKHAGYKDWEYWLTLHEAWLLQLPGGLLVLPVPVPAKTPAPVPLTPDGWVDWLAQHDIALIRRLGQTLLAYVKVKCIELTGEGLCGVHGTNRRPQMCSPYPEHPLDIQGIGFCTYRFDPVNRQQITEVSARPRPKPTPPRRKKRRKGRR